MKKFIIGIVIVLILYFVFYLILGGFPVGYKNGYLVVYNYTCADVCPDQGYWFKKYYGNISYDECIAMGEKPALVGFIVPGPDGKPGPGSIGGYAGCKVK